ncbi:hypothetical protein VTP01DRAFT_4632 [Rhizomucor pusillus]|uniref:uncharacterized protein n=1 Tax=Rhizomucor pusillus TaxID=4840 RepID=UPI003744A566
MNTVATHSFHQWLHHPLQLSSSGYEKFYFKECLSLSKHIQCFVFSMNHLEFSMNHLEFTRMRILEREDPTLQTLERSRRLLLQRLKILMTNWLILRRNKVEEAKYQSSRAHRTTFYCAWSRTSRRTRIEQGYIGNT